MARFDTIVKGGTVVIPYVGEGSADIGITKGRIAALAEDLGSSDADDVVDATGKVVLPGAIDSHYHLGIYRDLTEDAESETTSSLVGGVTTVLSYFRTGSHYLNKSGPYREILPEVLEKIGGHARVDFGLHLAPMTREHVEEIPWLVAQGISSFKYYMFYKGMNLAADSRDAAGYTMTEDYDLGHLFEIMEGVAATNAGRRGRISLSLHCEQSELLRVFIERAKANQNISGLQEYSEGRPPLTERLSIEEAAVLADATGVNVNFLHLSSRLALETAVAVTRRYPHLDVRRETTLHHLALAYEDLTGIGAKVNPPIRTKGDNEALWDALAAGSIDWIASDHACCMEEHKGNDLWPALPGFGGTALLYPVLLSEGHHRRGISLDRIAQVASAAPAQAYNLYGTKGTIAVGADADLAVMDPELEQVVTPELCQSAQDHTPFEGIRVKGWPTHTILRGRVVFQDGKIASGFHGRFVRR
jgi:dihydroorotase (multifunctional complex type)